MAGIKRTNADEAFSLCVRERSNWRCERCGTQYEPPKTSGLHCSHFTGRASKGVRYDPENAFAHCHGCHSYLGSRHLEMIDHYVEVFGQEALDRHRVRLGDITLGRRAHREKDEIAKHYREQHRKMKDLRNEGITGRIDFEDYFGDHHELQVQA